MQLVNLHCLPPQDRDPFVEDPNAEVHIGTVQVYMQSLAFMIEMKEQLDIVDYKGQAVGHVNLEVTANCPESICDRTIVHAIAHCLRVSQIFRTFSCFRN